MIGQRFTCGIASVLLLSFVPTLGAREIKADGGTAPAAALVGFAAYDGTTTGGGDANATKVTTFAELQAAVQDTAPRVIVLAGTIKTEGGYGLRIASNKTIVGADRNATLHGGLAVTGVSNVILRNFNLHGIWPNSGPDDALAVANAHHVWIDHLAIWDAGDGNLDITRRSDYVTVSWCKFWYTDANHPHRLNSLIGSGGGNHPEDGGKLHVTFHHNWFADLVDQRMPRVVYGQAHLYNNYYACPGNSYCIGVGSYGAALIENNYFQNVAHPHQFMYDVYAHIAAAGNSYDGATGKQDTGNWGTRDSPSGGKVTPLTKAPYAYSLDKAEDVPALVTRWAGPQ